MEQILTDVVKLVIMAGVAFAAYMVKHELIPLIRSRMTTEQLQTAQRLAEMFVYMAQQVLGDRSNEEKKAIVTEALKNVLKAKDISLSDNLVDDMIEAAVKGLKIAEASGKITVKAAITS